MLADAGIFAWIRQHEGLLWWLGLFSVVSLVLSAILVPILVVRIPPDYFANTRRRRADARSEHPVLATTLPIAKNLLGVVFILAGIAMLVLPGQGVLTILIGLLLTNFPAKYRLERWIVTRPPVWRTVNWIRRKAKHPPLEVVSSERSR